MTGSSHAWQRGSPTGNRSVRAQMLTVPTVSYTVSATLYQPFLMVQGRRWFVCTFSTQRSYIHRKKKRGVERERKIVKRIVKRSSKVPAFPLVVFRIVLRPGHGAWPRQRYWWRAKRTSGFWGQDGPTSRGRRGANGDRREAYGGQRLAGAVDGRWGGSYGSGQRKEVFGRIGRRRREDVRPIGLDERVERKLR